MQRSGGISGAPAKALELFAPSRRSENTSTGLNANIGRLLSLLPNVPLSAGSIGMRNWWALQLHIALSGLRDCR